MIKSRMLGKGRIFQPRRGYALSVLVLEAEHQNAKVRTVVAGVKRNIIPLYVINYARITILGAWYNSKSWYDLHKWNSNVEELEHDNHSHDEEPLAKQQRGSSTCKEESRLLALSWNKREDTSTIVLRIKSNDITKHEILSTLASVCYLSALVSPVMLGGKLVCREACKQKSAWDAPCLRKF